MLDRRHRFHGHASVQSVYSRGKAYRGGLVSLKVAANKRGHLRAAVVVSTKVSKVAPTRNRIRRRIYGVLPEIISLEQPIDLVITVYSDQISILPSLEIKQQLTQLCQQAGMQVPQK